ncbi:MAG: hypothetical protein IJN03_01215 [Bacilli bacterium]|nr:hypothetical protein [Bacilli bacterium]
MGEKISEENNDLQEQYLILEEEEKQENKRKLIFLIIILFLIILISVIGATFSYEKYKNEQKPVEVCKVNCKTDKDKKPDYNIDYEGDKTPHFNVDTNGDFVPDFNLMNRDINNDGNCDLNCDNNKDGWPDFNIDLDGDGIADLNIKEGGSKLTNMDTNGDGICDVKCNGITDEAPVDNNNNIVLRMDYEEPSIHYVGFTKTITAKDIIPGWKDMVEFKIVNNTPFTGYFRIRWIDVTNTITETNNITYRLSKDNKMVFNETRAPYETTEVFNKVLIPPNTTYTYKLAVEFKETYVDQSIDQNKVFKATLLVDAIN